MDQKAKEAHLDDAQWNRICANSLKFFDQCKAIKRVVFCHTIEPYKLFVKLCYDDGHDVVMELNRTTECDVEFPKCDVLAENVFERKE